MLETLYPTRTVKPTRYRVVSFDERDKRIYTLHGLTGIEARRESRKRWEKAHPEWKRKKNARYARKHREKMRALYRKTWERHGAKYNAAKRKKWKEDVAWRTAILEKRKRERAHIATGSERAG